MSRNIISGTRNRQFKCSFNAFIILISISFSPAVAEAATKTRITVKDQFVVEGTIPMFEAHLERQMIGKPALKKVLVSIWYEGSKISDSFTGVTSEEKGRAYFYLPDFTEVGNYEFAIKFDGNKKSKPASVIVNLSVRKADTPIFVSDIDHTLADKGSVLVVITPNEKIKTIKGSVRLLNQLEAEGAQIVYLTNRPIHGVTFTGEGRLGQKTKSWIKLKGYPPGPVYLRDRFSTRDKDKYKSDVIAGIRENFTNVLAGFGDKETDDNAYRWNDMASYIVDKKAPNLSFGIIENIAEIVAPGNNNSQTRYAKDFRPFSKWICKDTGFACSL